MMKLLMRHTSQSKTLLMDDSDEPIKHPLIEEIFSGKKGSSYFKLSN